MLDADEFQAWRDSPSTQWVLRRVAELAKELQDRTQARLYGATGMKAAEWADLQGQTGYDRGMAEGMNFVVGLELDDIDDDKRDSKSQS